MSELFEKNIELWAQKDPFHAAKLSLEEGMAEEISSKEEATDWLENFSLKNIEVLCVYGVGRGYFFEVLKPWLDQNKEHFLVFFEDSLAAIKSFFSTELATELLAHPQVWLYYYEDQAENKELLDNFSWNFVRLALGFAALPFYEKEKSTLYQEIKEKILFVCATKNAYLDEYFNYGIVFYRNLYPNLLQLPGAYLASGLFEKFQKVPAIICGAGPSLHNALPFIKEHHGRALIFAGGSALTALCKAGIKPHFGVGIDPNPEQYERLVRIEDFDYPFFYRNRLDHRSLKLARGPHLYVSGSGGYDTSEWFEKQLNLPVLDLDEGHNVVNFATEIATAMGCFPLIYVGMDLAFTKNKLYTPGILERNEVEDQEEVVVKNLEEAIVSWKDIHGQPIKTCWKWISESEWLSFYAEEHPEQTLVNATGEGIGFEGVANLSLEEVERLYLTEEKNLDSLVAKYLPECRLQEISKERLILLFEELKNSLVRCSEHLALLMEENEKIKERVLSSRDIPKHTTALAALAESDLDEEIGYKYVLAIFNEACSRSLYRQFQQSQMIAQRDPVQGYLLKMDLNLKRFAFLKTTALVNIEMIKDALKTES